MTQLATGEEVSTLGFIGCFTFLFGMALMFIAFAWFGDPFSDYAGLNAVFSRNVIYTTGTVIRLESSKPQRGEITLTPIVEIPLGKSSFRFRGVGSNQNPFNKGDMVRVAYPAGHPEKAYLRTFGQMYFPSLCWFLFASFPLALGVWGVIRQMRLRATR